MSTAKNIFLMVACSVAVILLWNLLDSVQNGSPDEKSYTEFIQLREKGRIREVTITQSGQVTGKYVPDGSQSSSGFQGGHPHGWHGDDRYASERQRCDRRHPE